MNYNIFRGFHCERLDSERIRLWNLLECSECGKLVAGTELTLLEKDNARIMSAGIPMIKNPAVHPRAIIPYAGGPVFCPEHWVAWITGKVLPSEDKAYDRV